MTPAGRAALVALALLGAVELVAEVTGPPELVFLTKPTILPLIGAVYLASVPSPRTWVDRRMVTAFAGSLVGDVSLMLAPATPDDTAILGIPKHPVWFLVGVLAFAVCHVNLISVFRAVDRPDVPGPFPRRAAWFVPLGLYGAGMAAFLVPRLLADPERSIAAVPVALYAGLLCAMVAFAIQRQGRVSTTSFALTAVGAFTFLVSDSLIGLVHLARVPLPAPGFLIMSTYAAAEALIAAGVATQRRGSTAGGAPPT